MTFKVGDIIKWDNNAAKVKDAKEQYGYITRIDENVYVRWFDLDYDQPFAHSTARRVFKVIS